MKIRKLDEMYVNIPLDDADLEPFETYTAENIFVPDSVIRNYIDTKYNADDLISVARQIDPDINNNDIGEAYKLLIDDYIFADDQNTGISDLDALYEYLDYCIYVDYYDDALSQHNIDAEDIRERTDWEEANRYEF